MKLHKSDNSSKIIHWDSVFIPPSICRTNYLVNRHKFHSCSVQYLLVASHTLKEKKVAQFIKIRIIFDTYILTFFFEKKITRLIRFCFMWEIIDRKSFFNTDSKIMLLLHVFRESSNFLIYIIQENILISLHCILKIEMVFCYQNSFDILWEKIIIEWFEASGQELQNLWDH